MEVLLVYSSDEESEITLYNITSSLSIPLQAGQQLVGYLAKRERRIEVLYLVTYILVKRLQTFELQTFAVKIRQLME